MKKILSVFFLACCSCIVMAQDNVIDEIVWVVGEVESTGIFVISYSHF